MAKQRGLGRGLDALFTESDIAREPSSSVSELRLTQIEPNKEQPRKTFDQKALQELAKSIEALSTPLCPPVRIPDIFFKDSTFLSFLWRKTDILSILSDMV